jgi:hypothetical protein
MRALTPILLIFMVWMPAHAGDDGRLYETTGRFSGTYRENSNGVIRLYGAKNEYLGSVYTRRDGTRRIYGTRGEYKGSTVERQTGISQFSERP